MSAPKILLYLIRRDIRLSDNPVFHEIASSFNQAECKFTHLLPVYIFPASQIETSGLFAAKTDYAPARSRVGGFWRCGHHRAKFLGESVWELKESLKAIGSDLSIRAGFPDQIVERILEGVSKPGTPTPDSSSDRSSSTSDAKGHVVEVWMTGEKTTEELTDEKKIRSLVEKRGLTFRLFKDEKYYVDDDDLPYSNISDLPDVFTTFRKSLEPLREKPRNPLPTPKKLPPLPRDSIVDQPGLLVPSTKQRLLDALLNPLDAEPDIKRTPNMKPGDDLSLISGHPFEGGEASALKRLKHLLTSGVMSSYKDTRNGLMGTEYSTKLSAYLSLGCLTARQIHAAMLRFEEGDEATNDYYHEMAASWKDVEGYGKGENEGTIAVRFELLWRDYMRLCAQKFGSKLFSRNGFRDTDKQWETVESSPETKEKLQRLLSGRTGIGLIDASQRELYLTGYTGNRARQNFASFLAKHLYIDWRLGAEWYESMLVDYDAASNWGNWQYVAGVGNDPREGRIFNPIKQALDYDKKGQYIKAWVPELRNVQIEDGQGQIEQERLMGIYQAWRISDAEKQELGLSGEDWVDSPLVKIQFSVGRKPKPNLRGGSRGNGNWQPRGRGGYRGGRGGQGRGRGGFRGGGRGRGFADSRPDFFMNGYNGFHRHPGMPMSG